MQMNDEQCKAFDELTYAHDEMKQSIDSISSLARGGELGWTQGMYLDADVGEVLRHWDRIQRALKVLYSLRGDE